MTKSSSPLKSAVAGLLTVFCTTISLTALSLAQTVLPQPDQPFKGQIGLRPSESVKDFPQGVKAPAGAPNILLVLTDDVGFGASSTFGGPIPTPTMDRLAASGLRYNQFHTTALCSPTRAALLTGRNHHSVGTAAIMELGVGYPGYNTLIPQTKRGLGDILKLNGYNTAWLGKNHNVPDWQTSQSGPFDLWPVGLGFEYFYGFIGGDTSQWAPAIVENTRPVEPPHDDPSYNFDKDMADKAINWMRMQNAVAPDKPFLLYYAPGTAHAPHHAPKEWIEKFKGKFDHGWDKQRELTFENQKKLGVVPADTKLTPRPSEIAAWGSLNGDQKKVFARMMEVYAAALAHCDYQIGRVLDAIESTGELDNTLVIYIQGDNGASAEGSPQGLLNEMALFNNIKEDFGEILRRMDELGGPMTLQSLPDRLGACHGHAVPVDQAGCLSLRWHAERSGDLVAKAHQRQGRLAHPVPSYHRHIADHPERRRRSPANPSLRRQAGSDRGRQHGVHLGQPESAFYPHHAIFRNAWEPRDLPRWLDGCHDTANTAVGQRRKGRRYDRWLRLGALQRRRGFLAIKQPGGRGAQETAGPPAPVLHRGGQVPGAAHRQQQGRTVQCSQPAESDGRSQHIHLLRRHGPNSRRIGPGP
jgi:arylsulfatase A-like enzyme